MDEQQAPRAPLAPPAPFPAASPPAPGAPTAPAAPAAPTAPPTAPPAPGGPAGPGQELVPGYGETELPPSGLWQRMKADPQYAPEHLALEAVQRLGPQARVWVERTRAQYPGIDPDTVAQIAVRRFTMFARLSGAAAGATGLPGAVIDIGVLAWTQARMVLHIAAAYGVDPTDPDRATDLLVLQKVHKYAQSARTALAVAAGHERASAMLGKSAQAPLSTMLGQLTWKLAQMAGVRAAKRMFAKMVPGAAIILGTWANSSATRDLGRRSVALYRSQPTGP